MIFRRLAAITYDLILLLGLLILNTGLYLLIINIIQKNILVIQHIITQQYKQYLLFLSNLIICYLFYCGFWIHGGQTLGMRAWKLRIRGIYNTSISYWQATLRFLFNSTWIVLILILKLLSINTKISIFSGLILFSAFLVFDTPGRISGTYLIIDKK